MTHIHAPAQGNAFLWALNDCYILTKRSMMHMVRNLDQLL